MSLKICIDSSIIVKWFKKGEEHEREALKLRDETLSSTVNPIICEWAYLEVVRALVKAGYTKAKIIQAYKILKEMAELGFINTVPVHNLLEKAKDLEKWNQPIRLRRCKPYNSNVKLKNMLTEDKHLLQENVRNHMEKLGLKVTRLKEFFIPHIKPHLSII
ncbi:MAG: hypothetical protein QXV01_10800 [Candidatus Bathyarchaeia archaeon]